MIKKVLKHATHDGKVKFSANISYKLMEEMIADANENNISRTAWLTLAVIERLARKKKENKLIN